MKTTALRGYGGVIIYVIDKIVDCVTVLIRESERLWLLFDKDKLGLRAHVILCGCYVIPSNSSAQANIDIEMFDYVISDFCKLKLEYPDACFLIGSDMNGRTAELDDFIVTDVPCHLPLPYDYCADIAPTSKRVNADKTVTPYGHRVIEVCKMLKLRIANGRINPDKQLGGKFTCTTYRGSSTVDYVLCSADHFHMIKYFEVKDITILSDHCPIVFSIEANIKRDNNESPQSTEKLVWHNDKKDSFVDKLNSNEVLSKLNDMCELIDSNNFTEASVQVNTVLEKFVESLRDATDNLFLRNSRPNGTAKKNQKPSWADNEWLPLKKTFLRNKDKFYRNRSESNRTLMSNSRSNYTNYINKRRLAEENSDTAKLLEARFKNIRLYWKLLKNPTKKDASYIISNTEFTDFFMKLSDPGDEFFTADENVKEELASLLSEELECAFTELNVEISADEIKNAIRALQPGKSSGEDLLLNEFYIHGHETLSPYLHKLFNFIFDKGIFPSMWSDGLLMPLHKKGSKASPDNYRGITLLSTLGKLFTRILNARYNKWAEAYGIYVEAQYGFRSGRGTVDCLFILHSAITSFINDNKALYTFFVDFSKAFDRVVYENLWFKMLKLGVNGKILNIVKSMYDCVRTKVFTNGIKSDPFYCTLGVRQGECLSPFLFSMYVNDLEQQLSVPGGGVDIGHFKLFLLMYADDVVIFADSPDSLQKQIDELYKFCQKWKLKVNLDKSKVLVFRKGTRLPRPQWKYGNFLLTVTNKIPYLGVMLTNNGLFAQAQKTLAEQANKGIFSLNSRLARFNNMKPPVVMDLFDKYISPILNYGSEVWGFHKSPDVEQVHLCFCKRLLGVKKSAQNDFVYGELGRTPLQVIRQCNIVRFWLKIISGRKSHLVNASYTASLENIDQDISYTWTRYLRAMLFECGFGEAWYNQGVGDVNQFYKLFRSRANEISINKWRGRIEGSTRADFYKVYKRNFGTAKYLSCVVSISNRKALSRLMTSSHRLRIETARWEKPRAPPRHERKCKICNKLDDEYHFVMDCSALNIIRKQLIPQNYWLRPSMAKFLLLINTESSEELNNLAAFCRRGFHMRQYGYKYPEHLCIFSFMLNPPTFA